MRALFIPRPALAASSTLCQAGAWSGIAWPALAASVVVQGRRQASVKAQGAYKKKSKRGIPKKLGAKRTGGE